MKAWYISVSINSCKKAIRPDNEQWKVKGFAYEP